jgi:DNA ligase-associated metallophosphoesterase
VSNKEIIIQDQHFILHPLKVVYWREQEALLIADLHIGKVTHFRKAGIAVPSEKKHEDIVNLMRVMHEFNPKQVFFLGDLFHSEQNTEVHLLEDFIDEHNSKRFHLVTGNHDLPGFLRRIGDKIRVTPMMAIGNFCLRHHPDEAEELFQFNGHLHPSVKMRNAAKQYLKLPCFYLTANSMVLPAFGSFTGSEPIRPKARDRVFVIAGNEVAEVFGTR